MEGKVAIMIVPTIANHLLVPTHKTVPDPCCQCRQLLKTFFFVIIGSTAGHVSVGVNCALPQVGSPAKQCNAISAIPMDRLKIFKKSGNFQKI